MAGRGAPLGNRNGAKPRLWEQAIQRAVRPKDLEEIALVVLQQAKEGNPWAITEIGNRLDGKPVQQVDMNTNTQPMTLSDALLAHIAMGGKPDEYNERTEH